MDWYPAAKEDAEDEHGEEAVGDEIGLNDVLSQLNAEQLAAVMAEDRFVRVLAGAGSGKTRVLTARVARLVKQAGVDASSIVLTTFTRKAASEMKDRLRQLLPSEVVDGITVGTFHSLGAALVRANTGPIGLPAAVTIADERATEGRVGRAMVAMGRKVTKRGIREALVRIEEIRGGLIEDVWRAAIGSENLITEPLAYFNGADLPEDSLYRRYHELCLAERAVDFDALGYLPVLLLLARPDLRDVYREQWRHLLVDEFQDTSRVQMMLIQLLTGEGTNVFVVGDDAQAIYGFRGASITNIQEFETIFPGTVTYQLTRNYRSQPRIVEAANEVSRFTGTIPKELTCGEGEEGPIRVLECAFPDHEAEALTDRLLDYRSEGLIKNWSDVMVLYRSNSLAREVELACLRKRIPVQISRGVRFFERAEPSGLLAPLMLAVNNACGESFRRVAEVIPSSPSEKTLRLILDHARDEGVPVLEAARASREVLGIAKSQASKVAELVQFVDEVRSAGEESVVAAMKVVLAHTGMRNRLLDAIPEADPTLDESLPEEELLERVWMAEQRVENVDTLCALAEDFTVRRRRTGAPPDVASFLDDVAVMLPDPETKDIKNAVRCMSIHSAKGLEAPTVAVIGCNEGTFPCLEFQGGEPGMMDLEEARLFYVAITRAEQHLILTTSRARPRGARGQVLRSSPPSRFLSWVPDWCHVCHRLS